MIVALAGGVGGARLAVGLAQVLGPRELTIVVNTGDDFEHLGLTICPDLDTVLYTLAGVNNPALGWGRADETWSCMQGLVELGGPTWFRLGDRDLALNLLRTAALQRGEALSSITARLARSLGVRHTILPMSETPVRTRVRTTNGELGFQDYFVRRRCRPRVHGFRFAGARSARIPGALEKVLASRTVDAVVICPSNPYVSIAPMLGIAPIARWLRARRFPVVAVSPIIGGAAVKGPAAKMMRELGVPVSALGIVLHYAALVDGWVIDRADASLAVEVQAQHKAVRVTNTLMRDRHASTRLAKSVIEFVRELAG
jgi:LPPG:FO 2-phospho-L-lactate transferase